MEKQMKNVEEISAKDGVKRIVNQHTNFASSRESTGFSDHSHAPALIVTHILL